jgi:hypothetical protein
MAQNNNMWASTHLVIGVTGHRNLRDEELPALQEKVQRFFQSLQTRYTDLPLCLLSSLATGSDQLVTKVALSMGIRVIAPLPMPPEQYIEDFDCKQSREVFTKQCQQAELLTLPLHHGSIQDSIKLPGPERDLQYALAGIFVSSHCHILLALWDGKESELLGGTAQVVNFHLQGIMPGPIDRRRAEVGLLGMDNETLVYHITVNRQNQEYLASNESSQWLASNQNNINLTSMPEAFDLMFRRHEEFMIDWKKYEKNILQQPTVNVAEAECPIHGLFRVADWLATLYQKRVGRILKTTYLLAAFMGTALIIYSDLNSQDEMLYLFLTFFLAGLGVASIAKRREWHRKYIDYRVLAEGLRVQSYWRRAGIVDINTPSFTHDNFLQKQDVELGWIRNFMRTASIDGLLKSIASAQAQADKVIEEWIGDPEHSGQLRYYSKTSEKRTRLHNRSEMLGHTCLWVGIAISVVLVIFAQLLQDELQNIMVASMGILAVAAAIHEAYAYKKADKALIKQYRFMQRIFTASQKRLFSCENVDEQRQILRTLGEAALAEHAEWTLLHRERPLENSKQLQS